MVREPFPNGAGDYAASCAGPRLFALLDERGACGLACHLRRGQSCPCRGCRPSASRHQPLSGIQIEPRLQRPNRPVLRGDVADLFGIGRIARRFGADRNAACPSVLCAWISSDVEFRCCLYRDDRWHAVHAAFQSGGGAISRAGPVRPRGMAAVRGDADCTAWAAGCDRHDGKLVGGHRRLCGNAAVDPVLFRDNRCASPVSVFARRARTTVVALDCRPVSYGFSVCHRGQYRDRIADPAGAIGQRFRN